MASKKDLDAGLLELKSGVTQAFRMELSYKRARYKVLVETYLWWRTASQKKGYLEDVFAREGIGYNTDLNRPNFKPFIKLVSAYQRDATFASVKTEGNRTVINPVFEKFDKLYFKQGNYSLRFFNYDLNFENMKIEKVR